MFDDYDSRTSPENLQLDSGRAVFGLRYRVFSNHSFTGERFFRGQCAVDAADPIRSLARAMGMADVDDNFFSLRGDGRLETSSDPMADMQQDCHLGGNGGGFTLDCLRVRDVHAARVYPV